MADEQPLERAREHAQRRARLAAVFGDTPPDSAGGERRPDATSRSEADYRADRPPHHGG